MGQTMSIMQEPLEEPRNVDVSITSVGGNTIGVFVASEIHTIGYVKELLRQRCGMPVETQNLVNLSSKVVSVDLCAGPDELAASVSRTNVLDDAKQLGWVGQPVHLQLVRVARSAGAVFPSLFWLSQKFQEALEDIYVLFDVKRPALELPGLKLPALGLKLPEPRPSRPLASSDVMTNALPRQRGPRAYPQFSAPKHVVFSRVQAARLHQPGGGVRGMSRRSPQK